MYRAKVALPQAHQTLVRVYSVSVWILVGAVLLQFFLAGLGIFAGAEFFFWHAVVNAAVLFFLPLALLVVGWRAGLPGGMLKLTAAVPLLVILQSLLLIPYHMAAPAAVRAISGLHVVNALAIFWVALTLLQRVRAQGVP